MASPIDTATPQENERRATRHVDAEKTAFRARLPAILQFCEHHQTGWNAKKCHVCHAKQHDNLLGNIRKGQVFQLPPSTRRRHRKTSDSRQDTWMQKNQHFVRDFRQFSQLATRQKDKFCSFPHRHGEGTGKPDMREETGGSTKTSISCETSSNFHTLQLQNRRFPTSFP